MGSSSRLGQFCPAILLLLLAVSVSAETTYTWNAPTGNWSNAANWSPNGVPGSGDNAVINNNFLTVDIPVTVQDLTISAGTIIADQSITVGGTMVWIAGRIDGSTTLQIESGAALIISGSARKELYGGMTLINQGDINWIGDGQMSLEAHAAIINETGAVFQLSGNAELDFEDPDGGSFTNHGLIVKSSGTGSSLLDLFLDSDGEIQVDAGTLWLTRGSDLSSTAISVDSDAFIHLNGETHSFDGVTLESGHMRVYGLELQSIGNGIEVNNGSTLEIISGVVSGAGDLNVDGTLRLSGGTIELAGAVAISNLLEITGTESKVLSSTAITLTGNATWNGSGELIFSGSSIFDIQSGATLNITDNTSVNGTTGSMIVDGAITKSAGTGTARIDIPVTNRGAITSNSGTLSFTQGSQNTDASFAIGSGAVFEFGEGLNHDLDNVSVSGPGTLNIFADHMTVSDGGVTTSTDITVNMAVETFDGDAPITIGGKLNWSEGWISGSGDMTVSGGLHMSGTAVKRLDGRSLFHSGIGSWTGTGNFFLRNNAQFINKIGANWTILDNTEIDWESPSGGTFTNNGVIAKNGGTGSATFDVLVINTGTIQVNVGKIEQIRGCDYTGGTLITSPAATMSFAFGDHLVNGTKILTGTCEVLNTTLILSGGGFTVQANGALHLNGATVEGTAGLFVDGDLTWSNGTIRHSGGFEVEGEMIIDGTGTKILDGETLELFGETTWSGSGQITLVNSAVILNNEGAEFYVTGNANMNGSTGTLENFGNLIKMDSDGTTSFDATLNNSGQLEIETGTILLNRPFVNFDSGIISGNGALDINNSFTNSGTVNPGNANAGTLTILGNYTQSSTATLAIDLGNPNGLGQEHDLLAISGLGLLNGKLQISRQHDYFPEDGSVLQIISYNIQAGVFAESSGMQYSSHLSFDLNYETDGVTLTTHFANESPLASGDSASVAEDESITFGVLGNDVDADGDTLSVIEYGMPLHGELTLVGDSSFTYTPAEDFFGLDSFTYVLYDNWNGRDTATVVLTVDPVNDAPTVDFALDFIEFASNQNAEVNIWESVNDLESDPADMSYSFEVGDDFLVYDYDEESGILTLSSTENEDLQSSLTVTVTDEEGAAASGTVTVLVGFVVGIDQQIGNAIPSDYALQQNYPNPFNPSTAIEYQLPRAGEVALSIYNMLGQKVRSLINSNKPAGIYRVTWDGRDDLGRLVPSGVYIYSIRSEQFTKSMKLILMK